MPAARNNGEIATANPHQSRTNGFLFALLLALLAHLFLILLFKPPSNQESKLPQGARNIFMLSQESRCTTLLKDVNFWLDCGDPTLFLKPNRPRGFSESKRSANAGQLLRDEPPVNGLNSVFQLVTGKFEPFKSQGPVSSCLWDLNTLAVPPLIVKKPSAAAYPLWRTAEGKILTMKIDPNSPLVKKIVVLSPKKASILLLRFPPSEYLPRVSISQSCGAPELDDWALKQVMASVDFFRKELGAEREATLMIEWQREEGQ
ncbi:MAG: hypothetical protein A2X49_15525 [Lentisphaerae bacterium GWF2_52_8]|nr:MAG: hypothetical protein A2X49_15525 [Lentisphaerae bacterium GWF2_52_8]